MGSEQGEEGDRGRRLRHGKERSDARKENLKGRRELEENRVKGTSKGIVAGGVSNEPDRIHSECDYDSPSFISSSVSKQSSRSRIMPSWLRLVPMNTNSCLRLLTDYSGRDRQ